MYSQRVSRIIISMLLMCMMVPDIRADVLLNLPAPGTIVHRSPAYRPVIFSGIKVHPENPLLFDFILDTGDSHLNVTDPKFKEESTTLIKYFLAALSIKEEDWWVNLSPYEKSRIIPEQLGQTVLGRDMLAQDYILKQVTSSLMYPEDNLGKVFWKEVYIKAQRMFGTTNIPVNTFNKVWIVADKAQVAVEGQTAYVVGSHLKVLLEEDYVATSKNGRQPLNVRTSQGSPVSRHQDSLNELNKQIIKDIILPELEKEVNQGKNFSPLRQIFHAMILSHWYKNALEDSFLNQSYTNRAKIDGVQATERAVKERIYQQYLQAYKKGVFNYVKEEIDVTSQLPTVKKYFSGGEMLGRSIRDVFEIVPAQAGGQVKDVAMVTVAINPLTAVPFSTGTALPWETADYHEILSATASNGNPVQFITHAESMAGIIDQIQQLAKSPVHQPIVILGLPGTGKELVWKAIHYLSDDRHEQPAIIHVADLNKQLTLLESVEAKTIVIEAIEQASPETIKAVLKFLANHENRRIIVTCSQLSFKEDKFADLRGLINTFPVKINIPSLDDRPYDKVLLFEFYSWTKSQELRVTHRPLSLEAGYFLASTMMKPIEKDLRQVRKIQQLVDKIWATPMPQGALITRTELIQAGVPNTKLPLNGWMKDGHPDDHIISRFLQDRNGIPLPFRLQNDAIQTVDAGNYLHIVHGDLPFYDPHQAKDPLVNRESAQEIIELFNKWLKKNIQKLGIAKIIIQGQLKPIELTGITLELGQVFSNGEYEIKVNMQLANQHSVRDHFMTGFPRGDLSVWLGLLSRIASRSDYLDFGFFVRAKTKVRNFSQLVLRDTGGAFGYLLSKEGGYVPRKNTLSNSDFTGRLIRLFDEEVKTNVGGIDLSLKKSVEIVQDQEMILSIDPVMMLKFQDSNFSGVTGTIIRIQSIQTPVGSPSVTAF